MFQKKEYSGYLKITLENSMQKLSITFLIIIRDEKPPKIYAEFCRREKCLNNLRKLKCSMLVNLEGGRTICDIL